MGKTAMVGKAEDRILEIPQDVDVRRFGCQRHCGRGQRRLAIEPGTPQARARQKMCDRFQDPPNTLEL